MKNKSVKLASAIAVLGAGIWVGTLWPSIVKGDSESLTPGSVEDPVVTKSYVDEQIAKLGTGSVSGGNNGGSNGSGESAALEVVEIPIGKTLVAAAGAEVVVRVGKAIAYSSDTNGISDLTAGTDIKKGYLVPTNHLIWFPREGRGIQGASDETKALTVLVKGSYTLQ